MAARVVLTAFATLEDNGCKRACATVFGASLVLLYTASTFYHPGIVPHAA